MKFILPDGKIVEGDTYEDIVSQMADEKLTEPTSQSAYRQATARRAADAYNVIIDANSDESFVKSLLAADLLRETK